MFSSVRGTLSKEGIYTIICASSIPVKQPKATSRKSYATKGILSSSTLTDANRSVASADYTSKIIIVTDKLLNAFSRRLTKYVTLKNNKIERPRDAFKVKSDRR